MHFQQIYRFEVDLLNKLAMSLPPEQSHPREISAGRYEFGWGASQDAAICKEPTKHNYATITISPTLIAIVVVIGNAFVGGELLQDFCQVLQSFSMETFSQEET